MAARPRKEQFYVRIHEDERSLVDRAAARRKMTTSSFIRIAMLRAVAESEERAVGAAAESAQHEAA